MEAAIQNEGNYDDTEDAVFHIEYEPPDPDSQNPDQEGAVVASLWDIFDAGVEPWDTIANDINGSAGNGIWRIFAGYRPNDFVQFYNDWLNRANGFDSQVTQILYHHKIIAQATPNTVQFNRVSYSVSEAAGSVTVTITRVGDTSGTVTVDYATIGSGFAPCAASTGVAAQNCDYEIASGTLTFAPGETSKDFVVLVNDDLYVEGDETVTIALTSPTGGAGLGGPSAATVTILDDDSGVSTTNPLATARFFAQQTTFSLAIPTQVVGTFGLA